MCSDRAGVHRSVTMYLPLLLSSLLLLPVVRSYYSDTSSNPCLTMVPPQLSEKAPQTSQPPYTVTATQSVYRADDVFDVTIQSKGSARFRAVYIQARRQNSSRNQDEPIGHFSYETGYKVACTGAIGSGLAYIDGEALNHQDKTKLSFTWDAPARAEGHVFFRVTVVRDDDTYWQDVRSGVILDPRAPPILDYTTQLPPPAFTIDTFDCGKSKGCYRNPADCVESQCSALVTWRRTTDHIHFELSADADGWVAIGFSLDKKMGEDDVTECVWNQTRFEMNQDGMQVQQSVNSGKGNEVRSKVSGLSDVQAYRRDGRIRCKFARLKSITSRTSLFNLDRDHHLLLAKGDVDHRGVKQRHVLETGKYPFVSPSSVSMKDIVDISGTARYPLAKLHGCLMLFAWMMCASVAMIMTKYYKPMWPNSRLCRERVWFAVHRGCMSMTFFATIIAFILIFIHCGGYSTLPDLPSKAHPILGIITVILCVINPIMSLCRCHEKSRSRPIFNWFHWLVGVIAMVLSTPAIFIGLNLDKVHAPWWVTWVMVSFMLFHLIIELLLEIHGCINGRKQKVREEEFWLQKKHDQRGELYGREPEPVGHHFKKRIITIYLFVVIVLGIVMIISVASG